MPSTSTDTSTTTLTDPIAFAVRLADTLGEFEELLRALFFIIGVLLVIQALRLSVRRVELGPQAVPTGRILTGFIIGTGMIAFPQTISALLGTVFGTNRLNNPSSIFAYGGELLEPFNGSRQTIEAIVRLIQFIGFIAVARGLLFLNAASTPNGPRSLGPGITFMVAGVLAVNFPSFFGALTRLITSQE